MTRLLAIIVLCGLAATVSAQQTLRLEDAIQIGLENNFDILIAEKQLEIAENNNTLEAAGFFPSLDFVTTNQNRFTDNQNQASFLQGKYSNFSLTPALQLNWVLFNGFRAHINKDKLELLESQSMGNAAVVVENTIQAIMLAYHSALLQKEKMDVVAEVLKTSRDEYNYFLDKKEVGTATTFDLLQIKNAWLTDSAAYKQQQIAYENSLRNLNLLMGREPETPISVEGELQLQTNIPAFEEIYSQMLSSNQTLQNQYINLEIFKKDIQLAQAQRYPVLSMGAGTDYGWSWFKQPGQETQTGETFNYYFNFTLSFNIYNGGQVRRAIENAKVQEQIQDLSIEQITLSLESQLRTIYDLAVVQNELVQINNELQSSAQLNLQLAEDRFRSGLITSFEFRDIQLAYLNAELSKLESIYNLIESATELTRLSGGLIKE